MLCWLLSLCRPHVPLLCCRLQLVAAFRATLEEIKDASLLLHVVDVSHPSASAQVRLRPRPRRMPRLLAPVILPAPPRFLGMCAVPFLGRM